MTKALLLDADGVTLQKHGYFSDTYSKEYNVPIEKILPFFKNEYLSCQRGLADIRDVLPKYLEEWGWEKSVDDFLAYWFKSNTVADEKVVNFIQQVRANGTKCLLATDQEKYRAEYTRQALGFNEKFDGCFFSCELGYLKSEIEFFQAVVNKLDLAPTEIIYFDDEQENVDAGKQVGIKAYFYTDFANFQNKLRHLSINLH